MADFQFFDSSTARSHLPQCEAFTENGLNPLDSSHFTNWFQLFQIEISNYCQYRFERGPKSVNLV